MNETAVSFTKVQKQALNNAQATIDEYCADKASEIDIWMGKKDLANPNTGAITGVAQTANLDLYVSEDDFETISKGMDFLSGSGVYLKGTFLGRELIAIKPRIKEIKKVVDGEEVITKKYVVTFTKQNVSRVTSIEQAEDRIAKAFDQDLPVMKVDASQPAKKTPF